MISFVVMTWNRNGIRLSNLLASLLIHQDTCPDEVIVVDISDDTDVMKSIDIVVAAHPNARVIRRQLSHFSKTQALNIGIRNTSQHSDYIACTDMDMMFSHKFVGAVLARLDGGGIFVMAEARRLASGTRLSDAFGNWDALCRIASPFGHERDLRFPGSTPGAVQAAERQWWIRVHGYDERFVGGLCGEDRDMWHRARADGLSISVIRFDKAQALHQWHEYSPLKGRTRHLVEDDPAVVKNLNGWGGM